MHLPFLLPENYKIRLKKNCHGIFFQNNYFEIVKNISKLSAAVKWMRIKNILSKS